MGRPTGRLISSRTGPMISLLPYFRLRSRPHWHDPIDAANQVVTDTVASDRVASDRAGAGAVGIEDQAPPYGIAPRSPMSLGTEVPLASTFTFPLDRGVANEVRRPSSTGRPRRPHGCGEVTVNRRASSGGLTVPAGDNCVRVRGRSSRGCGPASRSCEHRRLQRAGRWPPPPPSACPRRQVATARGERRTVSRSPGRRRGLARGA